MTAPFTPANETKPAKRSALPLLVPIGAALILFAAYGAGRGALATTLPPVAAPIPPKEAFITSGWRLSCPSMRDLERTSAAFGDDARELTTNELKSRGDCTRIPPLERVTIEQKTDVALCVVRERSTAPCVWTTPRR